MGPYTHITVIRVFKLVFLFQEEEDEMMKLEGHMILVIVNLQKLVSNLNSTFHEFYHNRLILDLGQ